MNQVRVGVGVFVRTQQGFVLMRRQGSHGAGEWSLPGGHVEFGETVEQCAVREVKEELDVTISYIHRIPHFSEDFFPDHNKQYITIYLIGFTHDVPKIMEPNKADALMFFKETIQLPEKLFCGTRDAWASLVVSGFVIERDNSLPTNQGI